MQLVHVKAADSHFGCLLCGKSNPMSMHLDFYADLTGTVYAEFITNPYLQGYKGILHGGVTCALLDSAMTHCLFNLQIEGVTGTDKQQNNFKGCARKEIRPFIYYKIRTLYRRNLICIGIGKVYANIKQSPTARITQRTEQFRRITHLLLNSAGIPLYYLPRYFC